MGRAEGRPSARPATGAGEAGRFAPVLRTVWPPEFAGMTFHEILARTALNQVADESTTVPGRWTSNPYRGCSHARTFCYARTTDRYLDLNTGEDIDNQIVVKTNLVDVLRREPATSRARLHPCATRWPPVGFVDGRKTTAFGFGLSREAPAPASEEQHGLF